MDGVISLFAARTLEADPSRKMTTHAIFIFLLIVDLHNFFWRLWLGYAANATVIIPIATNARLVART